jgi:small subunit ribosomal protein S2
MSIVSKKKLAQVGSQFGGLSQKWNPKMSPYIYQKIMSPKYNRKKIYQINLMSTEFLLEKAYNFAKKIKENNGFILFVCTKKQTKNIVKEIAGKIKMPYITEKWSGGILTNFDVIKESIKRLWEMEKNKKINELQLASKKENSFIYDKKMKRLELLFGGIKSMYKLPDAIYIVDTIVHATAVDEASKTKTPIIAVCNTGSNPEIIDYPIPANDNAIRSVTLITTVIASAFDESLLNSEILKLDENKQNEYVNSINNAKRNRKEEEIKNKS